MKKTAAMLLVGCVMWAVPASSQAPQPIVKSPPDTAAPDIPGVVAGGTRVQLIVGRGAVWKIAMIAQGYLGRAK